MLESACRWNWRVIVGLGVSASLPLAGCGVLYDCLGGAFSGAPSDLQTALSPGAEQLLDDAFAGIEPGRFADMHVHLMSSDMNAEWLSCWHPIKRGRTMVFLSAAGVEPGPSLEEDYVERLVELNQTMPVQPRCYLYALDRFHRADGAVDPAQATMYVSNDSVLSVAQQFRDVFVPVASIHPYRREALEELERCAAAGCRHVKWLPNSMGINPADVRIEPFYRKMKELGMILLTHTGAESAIEAEHQEFGNPLLLRQPLDLGVKVVALHSASDGLSIDLDDPLGCRVPSFDLFIRLMREPKYEGLLFGEISTMTFFDHIGPPMLTLLSDRDLQRRFVNGSDYPFCAVNVAIQTAQLARQGYITQQERRFLEEIYDCNPLLFDFAVKRTIRHPQTGQKLLDSVFLIPTELQ